jgi:hypothetical protein
MSFARRVCSGTCVPFPDSRLCGLTRLYAQSHSMPHTARAFETSVVKSSSLEKTAVIPHDRASLSMSAPLSAVSKKIAKSGAIAFSSRANCNPFISDREKSRTASFGKTCFVLYKASATLLAATQVSNPLPCSKSVRRAARKTGSSSTISTAGKLLSVLG